MLFLTRSLTCSVLVRRHSVRVIHNSRRWWYQPQALVREKSGLTESPGVWFLRSILRSHGYDHTTLTLVVGKQVTAQSWQVGDFVVPKKLTTGNVSMDCVGRIVAENSSSTSSLSARGRDSGSVLVEFISKKFAESAGIQMGSSSQGSEFTLETRRVPVSRLLHSTSFHGTRAKLKNSSSPSSSSLGKMDSMESMEIEEDGVQSGVDCAVGEKAQNDINSMKMLDVGAIDALAKECKKNATTLAALFSAGLQEGALEAIDLAAKRAPHSKEVEMFSQAVSALGRLPRIIFKVRFNMYF